VPFAGGRLETRHTVFMHGVECEATALGGLISVLQADLNLGIQTYLNGAPMNPIVIDTSQAATDTIDYVVTDQSGSRPPARS
jgi:hypothetical protein